MLKNYIQAARLRTLPLSLSGVILGAFIAKSELAKTGTKWSWAVFILACITTILYQILSNFANDYGDGVKGTDNDNRIGPQRAIQSGKISPKAMRNVLFLMTGLALLSTIGLIFIAFGISAFWKIILFFILGIISIIAAIKYTVGKSAYGYHGMGDLFVLIFFGLVAVLGSYFLFVQHLRLTLILPALMIGFWSVAVLNLNNMRDEISDKSAKKNTLVVMMGHEAAVIYHFFLIIMPFIFLNIYILFEENYKLLWIMLGLIPFIFHLIKVWNTTELKNLDSELKKVALTTFFLAILMSFCFNC